MRCWLLLARPYQVTTGPCPAGTVPPSRQPRDVQMEKSQVRGHAKVREPEGARALWAFLAALEHSHIKINLLPRGRAMPPKRRFLEHI